MRDLLAKGNYQDTIFYLFFGSGLGQAGEILEQMPAHLLGAKLRAWVGEGMPFALENTFLVWFLTCIRHGSHLL
jgi:hypothetical protein